MTENKKKLIALGPAMAPELFRILGIIEKVAGTWMFQMKDSKISQWIDDSNIFVELDLEELLLEKKKNQSSQSTDGQMDKPSATKGVDLSFLVYADRLKKLKSLLGSPDIKVWYDKNAQAYIFDNEYNRLDIPATFDSQVFTQSPCTNLKPIGGPVTLDETTVKHIMKYIRNHKPWGGHLLIYDDQLEGYQAYGSRPFFFNPDFSKEINEREADLKFQISFFLAMLGNNQIDLNLGTTESESGTIHWLISESEDSKSNSKSKSKSEDSKSKAGKGYIPKLIQMLL